MYKSLLGKKVTWFCYMGFNHITPNYLMYIKKHLKLKSIIKSTLPQKYIMSGPTNFTLTCPEVLLLTAGAQNTVINKEDLFMRRVKQQPSHFLQ